MIQNVLWTIAINRLYPHLIYCFFFVFFFSTIWATRTHIFDQLKSSISMHSSRACNHFIDLSYFSFESISKYSEAINQWINIQHLPEYIDKLIEFVAHFYLF